MRDSSFLGGDVEELWEKEGRKEGRVASVSVSVNVSRCSVDDYSYINSQGQVRFPRFTNLFNFF